MGATKQQKLEHNCADLHSLVDEGEAKQRALQFELRQAESLLEGLKQQHEQDQQWLMRDSCGQMHEEVQAAAALAFAASDGKSLDSVEKVKEVTLNTSFQLRIK